MKSITFLSLLVAITLFGSCDNTSNDDEKKLIILAEKGLKSNYNVSFKKDQTVLIKGDEVKQWIEKHTMNRAVGVRNHINEVLEKYLADPNCFALVVKNLDSKITKEVLVIHIPTTFRNDQFDVINYLIADKSDPDPQEEEWCNYCSGQNPPGNSLTLSDMPLNNSSDCACVCECNPKSSGPCGNDCTSC